MSESSKQRNVAKEIHYLAQLACDSPGGEQVKCSHFKAVRAANEVLAVPVPSGQATQEVWEYTVPAEMCLLVTLTTIRSDASQADFSEANQVLRSDSDGSPALGACAQLAQWLANGNNKTPVMPWLALINSSSYFVFRAGEIARLLVNAGVVTGQRVNLTVCVEGYLLPSGLAPIYATFESQCMVEHPCAIVESGIIFIIS